jgi:hypothetical protein
MAAEYIKKKMLSCKLIFIYIIYFICAVSEPGQEVTPIYPGFADLNENNKRIIFIGDTQKTSFLEKLFLCREDNKNKTPLLLAEIVARRPALMVNLGDLVFSAASARSWNWFDLAHHSIREANIPVAPILGNHEYWHQPDKSLNEFYFPRFPHLFGQKWYCFSFQQIGFLMLDGNIVKKDPAWSRQLRWYEDNLRLFENDLHIRWIIVCCHQPPFTNSKVVAPNYDIFNYFGRPFAEAGKTVFFLSGHCHAYEKFIFRGKWFIVSGGGGGPRHELKNATNLNGATDPISCLSLSILHFCQLDILPDGLLFQVIALNDDGSFTKADCIEISKDVIFQSN